ncbi:hypothetical protein ACQ4PT_066657 [Festuca glaucescens]
MSDVIDNVGDNDANASTMGFGTVDWSSLIIEQNDDDAGFNVPVAEDHMFSFLGLRDEGERPMEDASGHDTNVDVVGNTSYEDVDIEGAAIPVDDYVPGEENMDYDMDNPTMAEGNTFPSMEVFRVAVKQYAITGEFDIGTVTNMGPDHDCLTSSRKPSRLKLGTFTTDAAGELDVLGHDGDTLGVDSAEVGVLEESDKLCLGRLLEREHGVALEAEVRLEVLCDLPHQVLERQLCGSAGPCSSGTCGSPGA